MATQENLQALLDELLALGFDRAHIDDGHVRVACSQCEALCINGEATHESGCPNGRASDLYMGREEEDALDDMHELYDDVDDFDDFDDDENRRYL